jgi:hypothetical protein
VEHHLTPADHTVAARVGDVLVIELPSLAGAGYQWTLDALPDALEDAGRVATSTAIGSGIVEIRIRVIAPFTGDLRWQNIRSWERPSTATARYDLHVTARA